VRSGGHGPAAAAGRLAAEGSSAVRAVLPPAPVSAPSPGAAAPRRTTPAGSRSSAGASGSRAARHDLREQIARLEGELAAAAAERFPRREPVRIGRTAPALRGPRPLCVGELERVRDDLVDRVAHLRAGGAVPLLAAMRADPAAHHGAIVTSAELGDRGCRVWAVRARFGPLGRLAGWWRVVVSSGCPLAVAVR
jgi:hypothetical protein